MLSSERKFDSYKLFSAYMQVTGVPHLHKNLEGDPRLGDKRLGLLNGSSWISLWSGFFGRRYLPEVQLVNVGNDATQLNFMQAHALGEPCPPNDNIEVFVRYACDLVELGGVDAILITCSTMNRSFGAVERAMHPFAVPVVQIDMPMMEGALSHGSRVLVVATHGSTVPNTCALLEETASALHRDVTTSGVLVEEAWHCLDRGDVEGHNLAVAEAIRTQTRSESVDCVVLAQLSMSVFALDFPQPQQDFGIPVLTSAECGFSRVRDVLLGSVGLRSGRAGS
jgi:Asp/Glu/hydantoin racemase